MSIEAAAIVYAALNQHTMMSIDPPIPGPNTVRAVELVIAAFVGDRVLYAEPDRCLHRYLSDYQVCDDCGAVQRWVVQVWPEVE